MSVKKDVKHKVIQVIVTEDQFNWFVANTGRSRSEFVKQLIAEKYPDFPPSAAWGSPQKKH